MYESSLGERILFLGCIYAVGCRTDGYDLDEMDEAHISEVLHPFPTE